MLISGAQALGFRLDPSAKTSCRLPHLGSPDNISLAELLNSVAVYAAMARPAGEARQAPPHRLVRSSGHHPMG